MLELKSICYRVDSPEGAVDILDHIDLVIPDHKLVVFYRPQRRRQDHAGQGHHGAGAAHGGADPL